MEYRYKADTIAAVTKIPRGSLGPMRARGHIPSLPYDLGDLLSLTLARHLMGGIPVEAATAIAWAAKETWAEVISAKGEAHERTRYIMVTSNEPGDPVPYTWVVSGSGEALVDQIAAGDARGLCIVVNMTAIATDIMASLLAYLRANNPEAAAQLTTNGTLKVAADPAPERRDRELA